MRKIRFRTSALALSLVLFAGSASAQPTWKLINPSGSGGSGGSGTACAYTQSIPVFSRMVPVETTIQYNLIGGGGGGTNDWGNPGGTGGDTYILVNGVNQASASGGNSENDGAVAQGSVTLSAGDFLEIRIGGGGGGAGYIGNNGRDAVDGTNGSSSGYRGGGGGGGWGSGGGRGATSSSGSGTGGGSNGDSSTTIQTIAPGVSSGVSRGAAGGRDGQGGKGGQAGFVDISYSSSGCWIQ